MFFVELKHCELVEIDIKPMIVFYYAVSFFTIVLTKSGMKSLQWDSQQVTILRHLYYSSGIVRTYPVSVSCYLTSVLNLWWSTAICLVVCKQRLKFKVP